MSKDDDPVEIAQNMQFDSIGYPPMDVRKSLLDLNRRLRLLEVGALLAMLGWIAHLIF